MLTNIQKGHGFLLHMDTLVICCSLYVLHKIEAFDSKS